MMNWILNLSIRGKLMVASIVPVLIVLVLGVGSFVLYDFVDTKRAIERDLTASARFIGAVSRAALMFDVPEDARRILEGLEAEPQILCAAIYDRNGRQFTGFRQSHFGGEIPNTAPADGFYFEFDHAHLVQPISLGMNRVGSLYLYSDLSELKNRLLLYGFSTLLGMVLVAVVALAVSRRFQRIISDPIVELAAIARKVSEEKDYFVRAEKRSQDEVGLLTDAFNQMLTRIQETIAELEAFSYSVSHDLRAPLRAIHGYAQVLLEDERDRLSSAGGEHLERIRTSTRRLDQLVQDLLTYSRLVRTELPLSKVDLNRLLPEVIQQYPNFRTPHVCIEIVGPLYSVRGHEASLTQCIANLLTNACKFVAPNNQPHVRVWSESNGNEVRLFFHDNGIGIDAKDHKRIFEIFESAHSGKGFEGTGIGLSIVRKAVERMGGKVGLESEVGKGSKFWIELNKA